MMLQHDTPDDFVLATGECHAVREFVEKAFKHIGYVLLPSLSPSLPSSLFFFIAARLPSSLPPSLPSSPPSSSSKSRSQDGDRVEGREGLRQRGGLQQGRPRARPGQDRPPVLPTHRSGAAPRRPRQGQEGHRVCPPFLPPTLPPSLLPSLVIVTSSSSPSE